MTVTRILACFALGGLCVTCRPQPDARQDLQHAFQQAFGTGTTWDVGFSRSYRHLLIHVQGAFLQSTPDSLFARRARGLARFAVRHYKSPSALDSITISEGTPLSVGTGLRVFRVRRSASFSVAESR